jgi:NADPH-dependent 2,4-dienoyl-CoA reductase/sulfur reductase-like enzyme
VRSPRPTGPSRPTSSSSGTGVRPRSELAEAAGIPIGPSGGIVTDDRQSTPSQGCGPPATAPRRLHRVTGLPVSFALGTIANKQGRIAGLNLGGAEGRFPGVLGTAVTKIHDLEIARTGLGVREAEAAGCTLRSRASPPGPAPTTTPTAAR